MHRVFSSLFLLLLIERRVLPGLVVAAGREHHGQQTGCTSLSDADTNDTYAYMQYRYM